MWSDRPLLSFSLLALLYAALFLLTALPSLTEATGVPWFRWRFLQMLLVPEALVLGWVGTPPQPGFLDRLPILGAVATIVFVAWCVGWLIMQSFTRARYWTRLEHAIFSIAVGLNFLSLYTLLVGLAGLVHYRLVFFLPGMIAIVSTLILWLRNRHQPRLVLRGASHDSYFSSPWLWLAAPFALFIVLGGMLPPIDFDVREYHLQAPKEFFRQGRITFMPNNVYANMTLGSEMHSMLGMSLLGDWWRGAIAGKTVQSLFAPLTALTLLAAGRRWFSTSVGSLAALVYLSTPWVAVVSTTGLVEGALAFYALLTLYAFLLIDGQPAGRAPLSLLALAGYLSGSAVATKYTGTLFVLLPAALAVAYYARPRAAKGLAIFLIMAFAACGPWFVKNWALTGNPVYPLLPEVFESATRTPDKNERWHHAHAPVDFSLRGFVDSVTDFTLRSPSQSLLIWPLAAIALLTARQRQLRLVMGYVIFYFMAWWFFTHRIDRFWVPSLAALALVSGGAWIWATTPARRWILSSWITLGVVYSAVVVASPLMVDNSYFVRLDYLRIDPTRVAAWHQWLNQNTPPDKTVLAVGDAQVFDLEMPVLYNTAFDDSVFEQIVRAPDGNLRASAEIRHRLRDVAFVYVNWGEIARYRSPGNYGYSDFVEPQVFDQLVERGVLKPPVQTFVDGAVQIYAVAD